MSKTFLPEIQSGYELNKYGWFSIVRPEYGINYIVNPSFEGGIIPYSLGGPGAPRNYFYGFQWWICTVAASSTHQYEGATGCAITPTATSLGGIYYTISLTAGQPYTASCYIEGNAENEYALFFHNVGTATIESGVKYVRGNGKWQRLTCTFVATASTSYAICCYRKAGGNLKTWYTDCWQLENKAYATTWFCGSSLEKNSNSLLAQPYNWSGIQYNSSSYRFIEARNSGRAINLNDMGFKITGVVGLGMNEPSNIIDQLSDGKGYYNKTIPTIRNFSLVGSIYGMNQYDLSKKKNALYELLSPFGHNPNAQPMLMLYQPIDDCGVPTGTTLRIYCFYKGGLSSTVDNLYGERISIDFEMADPYIYGDNYNSISLGYQTAITNANSIAMRDRYGNWTNMVNGMAGGYPEKLLLGPDSKLYAVGSFTSAGGVAKTKYIARWNGITWESLYAGADPTGVITDMCFSSTGILWITGGFTAIDGVTATRVASWDGTTWSALIEGGNNGIDDWGSCIISAHDGMIYVGGLFTTAGGHAAVGIAKWNPNTSIWSSIGSIGPAASLVETIALSKDGTFFVGGSFHTVDGGTAALHIARYDPVTDVWTALNDGLNNNVNSISISDTGNVYIAGKFTASTKGVVLNSVALYNGAMIPLLGGVSNDAIRVKSFTNNSVYFSGLFTSFYCGGKTISLPDRVAIWNGSTFVPLDIYFGNVSIENVESDKNNLYISFSFTGTGYSSAIITKNISNQKTYPYFRLTGPGTLWQIKNYTTGKSIFFNGLTLMDHEIIHVNLENAGREIYSIWSTIRGNISSYILPGSDMDNYLAPGDNNIGCLFYGGTSSNTTSFMFYRDTFLSIDGATK